MKETKLVTVSDKSKRKRKQVWSIIESIEGVGVCHERD